MGQYHVSYRGEFGCDVEAKNPSDAITQFDIKMRYFLESDLWDCYYEVFDENGNEVYQNR